MEATRKPEFSAVKDREDASERINKTDSCAVTGRKQLEETEMILNDLIRKISVTFVQTGRCGDPAAYAKKLMIELNKPIEVFSRIKNINISQYLEGKRLVNVQTSEKGNLLKGTLKLSESVEDRVKDVLENIIKKVENENLRSGESKLKRKVAATETGLDYIGYGEDILKEKKMIEEIEQFVNNLIKEVKNNLIYNSSELTNKKPVEELKLPSSQQNLSKTIQIPVDKIKDSLQNPHESDVSLFTSDISTDCEQQSKTLKDCFEQTNVSTDSLQQNLIDCSSRPNLPIPNQLQQDITSTDCLEQKNIADSLQQRTSVSPGQHANTTTESMHQTRTKTDFIQDASASPNSPKHAHKPVLSMAEEIVQDRYLSDIVETAHRLLNGQIKSNPKTRRAATLVQSISNRSMQSNTHHLIDNLLEVQNMIDIIDGIGDLNEYLHMDIRKLFLARRELRRISCYVYEHLAIITMCKSREFLKKIAGDVTQIGADILIDIKTIKKDIFSLFKNYFLIQRTFLKQSLKVSSVPYEWLIGDRRYTLLMNKVKIYVLRLCGTIFGLGELEELYQAILSKCTDVVRLLLVFTELAVQVDHTQDIKKQKKVDEK